MRIKHQGTSSQFETKQGSDEVLRADSCESRAQVQRYIRLTHLIPEFLDKMDEGNMILSVGVELSYKAVDGVLLDEFVVAQLSNLSDESAAYYNTIFNEKLQNLISGDKTEAEYRGGKEKQRAYGSGDCGADGGICGKLTKRCENLLKRILRS